MMYKTLFSLGIALIIAVFSCKKEPESTPINAEIKSRFSFKKGTYWVYRDAVSGEIDSIVIVEDSYSKKQQNTGVFDEESHRVNIFENGVASSYNSAWALSTISVSIYYEFASSFRFNFGYPFYPAGTTYFNSHDSLTVGATAPLAVNGVVFNNVCAMNYKIAEPSNYSNDSFFVSADVGIVKMSLSHVSFSKKLELLRYNLVR